MRAKAHTHIPKTPLSPPPLPPLNPPIHPPTQHTAPTTMPRRAKSKEPPPPPPPDLIEVRSLSFLPSLGPWASPKSAASPRHPPTHPPTPRTGLHQPLRHGQALPLLPDLHPGGKSSTSPIPLTHPPTPSTRPTSPIHPPTHPPTHPPHPLQVEEDRSALQAMVETEPSFASHLLPNALKGRMK